MSLPMLQGGDEGQEKAYRDEATDEVHQKIAYEIIYRPHEV
jgi:hypothetical protein